MFLRSRFRESDEKLEGGISTNGEGLKKEASFFFVAVRGERNNVWGAREISHCSLTKMLYVLERQVSELLLELLYIRAQYSDR